MTTTFTPFSLQAKVLALPDDALVLEEFYCVNQSAYGPVTISKKCIKPKKLWYITSGLNHRKDSQRYFNQYKVSPYDESFSI